MGENVTSLSEVIKNYATDKNKENRRMNFGFVAYVDCKNGTHTVLLSWNATDVPSTPPDNKDGLFLMFDIIVLLIWFI